MRVVSTSAPWNFACATKPRRPSSREAEAPYRTTLAYDRRPGEADALERPHQHAVSRQRAQHELQIGAVALVDGEHALRERELIEPLGALAHVGRHDVLRDPCGVDW